MALRSLDNALPDTEERPKKVAKIALQAKSDILRVPCANDENAPPLPKAVDQSVDYISSEELKPLSEPETEIKMLLEELDSKDWTKSCEALNNVRRFALYHSSLLHPILNKVMLVMVKAMKNPRSALCKTSIMASTDIIHSFGHLLLPSTSEEDAFDHLLLQLLLKASQDKRFVCEEAEKALQQMTSFVPPLPLIRKLQSYVKHANPKVRAKAAVSISDCITKMDIDAMKEFGLAGLLSLAAELLNDRLPEARESARSIANAVYKAFCGDDESITTASLPAESSWQDFCSTNLPPISAQSIVKITSQL